jgi:hypothetical protein
MKLASCPALARGSLVAAAALSFSMTSTAWAVPDHLQCFKIKDDIEKTGYTFTITPDDPTFPAAAGCTMKTGAKLLCVDSSKSAVTPSPPGAPDGAQPGKFFCYKARCPVSEPTFTGDDQFGTHGVEVKKTQFLCAPVDTVPTTTTTLPECFLGTDCPGSDTQCSQRTCVMNECGVQNAPPGTQLMTQMPGDCQTAICDGMGNVSSQVNGMDPPADDGNDCTGETCAMGFPAHPAHAVNTPCSSNGGTVCNGAGTCVQCNAALQCPGMDTDCQTRVCSSGTCGVMNASPGVPTSSQTAGDCQENVCNGMGSVMSQADDSDVPVDGNDCTSDTCTAGMPANTPLPQNSACSSGGGSFCSSSGTCVQCNVASQCPGIDTDCQLRSCSAGNCGVSFQPAGTPCSSGGGTQCDGFGGCI